MKWASLLPGAAARVRRAVHARVAPIQWHWAPGPVVFALAAGASAARCIVRLESAGFHGATWLDLSNPAALVQARQPVAVVLHEAPDAAAADAAVAVCSELGWGLVLVPPPTATQDATRALWSGQGVHLARREGNGVQWGSASTGGRIFGHGRGPRTDGTWAAWPLHDTTSLGELRAVRDLERTAALAARARGR